MNKRARFFWFGVIFLCFIPALRATTLTWTGATGNQWSNPLNWSPTAIPTTGDDLIFNGASSSPSSGNDLSGIITFNSLTIANHAITGNQIILNNGLSVAAAQIGLQRITLNANQPFTATTANNLTTISSPIDLNGRQLRLQGAGNLTITGIISGAGGSVTSTGSGIVRFNANNTYTGTTRVQPTGVLQVFGSQAGSAVEIEGGTLGGSGTVGAITLENPPATVAPGVFPNGSGILTVSGNLAFSASQGTLAVDLNGLNPGSGYDQVRILNNGTVNLAPGSALKVTVPPAFFPAPGSTFIIINNDGTDPVQGSFEGLPGGSFVEAGTKPFSLTYQGGDGNDVVLSVPATWQGGGADLNWTRPGNWVGNVPPVPGQALFFPRGGELIGINDFPNGTFFPGMLFRDRFYDFGGNAITLGAGGLVLDLDIGGSVGLGCDITLAAPARFQGDIDSDLNIRGDVGIGSHLLTVDIGVEFRGAVFGTGEIHQLSGFVSFRGPTTVGAIKSFGGHLHLASEIATPVFLDPAGVALPGEIELTGDGSIGPLSVGGAVVSPGFTTTAGRLTVNGNLFLTGNTNVPASFTVDLAGATGNNQDKLLVNGAVKLTKANLSVQFHNGFVPAVGSSMVVIANDGTEPIEGTFVAKPEGSTFVVSGTTLRISYQGGDGNDVALTGVAAPPPTRTPSPKLANISTRLRVQAGENVLIGGMIATGTEAKTVIIRAIGPILTDLGLPGALPDPTLQLFKGNDLQAENDDWRLSENQQDIEHSGFAPGKDQESAIIFTLTPNENYTAVVKGKDGQTGIALVEAFDLDELAPAKLTNISTRGLVDVGDRVMIAGLIVGPADASNIRVLVRALGPTLGDFGVQGFLADPTLELRNSNGGLIRASNDWKNDGQRLQIESAQLAPNHDPEAALIELLPPGAYTAIVRGAGSTTGVGLVEVYNIQ